MLTVIFTTPSLLLDWRWNTFNLFNYRIKIHNLSTPLLLFAWIWNTSKILHYSRIIHNLSTLSLFFELLKIHNQLTKVLTFDWKQFQYLFIWNLSDSFGRFFHPALFNELKHFLVSLVAWYNVLHTLMELTLVNKTTFSCYSWGKCYKLPPECLYHAVLYHVCFLVIIISNICVSKAIGMHMHIFIVICSVQWHWQWRGFGIHLKYSVLRMG